MASCYLLQHKVKVEVEVEGKIKRLKRMKKAQVEIVITDT